MDGIQALKENEKPFCRMSKEMQDKAIEMIDELDFIDSTGKWAEVRGNLHKPFDLDITYRLRPDYGEEPKVVKYGIYPNNDGLLYCNHSNEHQNLELGRCCAHPDFIGFLYEDGKVRAETRYYGGKFSNHFSEFRVDDANDVTVLTPTHVLFKRAK